LQFRFTGEKMATKSGATTDEAQIRQRIEGWTLLQYGQALDF
jgi:hypothetical protein